VCRRRGILANSFEKISNIKIKGDQSHPLNYFLGLGGLLPLPPPDGFPVVLGPLGGLRVDFAIGIDIIINAYLFAFRLSHSKF
jgi:hypothetical protein